MVASLVRLLRRPTNTVCPRDQALRWIVTWLVEENLPHENMRNGNLLLILAENTLKSISKPKALKQLSIPKIKNI